MVNFLVVNSFDFPNSDSIQNCCGGLRPPAPRRKSQKVLPFGYSTLIFFYDFKILVLFFHFFRFPCRRLPVFYKTIKNQPDFVVISLIKRSSTHWCQPFQRELLTRSGCRVMTIQNFLCHLYQLTLSTSLLGVIITYARKKTLPHREKNGTKTGSCWGWLDEFLRKKFETHFAEN